MKLPPFELIMRYTPCAHQAKNMQKLPMLQDHIKHVQQIRQEAQITIQHAQCYDPTALAHCMCIARPLCALLCTQTHSSALGQDMDGR